MTSKQAINQKPINNGLFISLLVILVLAPLFFGCTTVWTEAALSFLVGFLSITTILAMLTNKLHLPKVFYSAWPFHVCFIFLLLWQIAMPNWMEIVDANNYQRGLRLTFTYYLLFNLTLILCTTEKQLMTLMTTIVVSGVFQAIYGALMVLTGIEMSFYLPKFSSIGIVTGTLSTRNTFAGYLEISLACALGLLVGHLSNVKFDSSRERTLHFLELLFSPKILLRVGLAVMVIALVMSHSRMGNTAFFSSMIICGFLFMLLRKSFTRNAIILFLSLIIIDTMIISQFFGLDELVQRFRDSVVIEVKEPKSPAAKTEMNSVSISSIAENELASEEAQTVSINSEGRTDAWREALPMIDDFGLKGAGYESFYTLFSQYRNGTVKGFFDYAHNDYLQLVIEYGFFGAGCLGLLGLMGMLININTIRKSNNKITVSAAFAAMMGLLSISIHSSVDFNLYIPSNAGMVCVLLALAVIARWGRSDKLKIRKVV